MSTLTVENFVRQRLSDRETVDYFPGDGELTDICWRHVVNRSSQTTLTLCAVEVRGSPLAVAGSSEYWMYDTSQYVAGVAIYPTLQMAARDQQIHQPGHKYALFQVNAFDDGVHQPSAEVNEVTLAATFEVATDGPVTLRGYALNLSRLMFDVFQSIADDLNKLAIYQSTLGGTVDITKAGELARKQGATWLKGTIVPQKPLKGINNFFNINTYGSKRG